MADMAAENKILLRRKTKLMAPADNGCENIRFTASIMKNFEGLGYIFAPELIEQLNRASADDLSLFYNSNLTELKHLAGVKNYKPMYHNFPKEVMDMSKCELYINAFLHYFSDGKWRPESKEIVAENTEQKTQKDKSEFKVIGLAEQNDLQDVFQALIQSKTSLSETDKEDLCWFLSNYDFELPEIIPFKENVALVCKYLIENNSQQEFKKYINTATDMLRVITAMSEGDVSLAENTLFRNLKRRERRLLLSILNNVPSLEEDMKRYKSKWIRIGEILHPFEYKQFPRVIEAFRKLRDGEKIETFGGRVAASIENKDFMKAIILLKERPGELARRIDHLLRSTEGEAKQAVIDAFREVAEQVSTNVLLQVKTHFDNRMNRQDIRVFFPKGNTAIAKAFLNDLPELDKADCSEISNICKNALIKQYELRKYLGAVYLSEELRNYMVPFSQRSASKALKTIVRGSRLTVGKGAKVLRSFIWWKNGEERTDIDLSAAIYDENFGYVEHVSYTKLKSTKYDSCHSGDIVDAPVGASEFIDIGIDSVLKFGGRYVVFTVFSYTQQQYCDLPECFMGWMERKFVGPGEIYNPEEVKNKIDLTAPSKMCVPMVFDLLKHEMIWMDLSCKNNPFYFNNLEGNNASISELCRAVCNVKKPNLYELVSLHIKARGYRTEDKETADIIFDVEKGNGCCITPFDTEIFMGEYI